MDRNARTFVVGLLIVVASIIAFIAIGGRGSDAYKRTDYCNHVLRPKVCELVVARGEFETSTECQHELSVYEFCHEPIQTSLEDMKRCVHDMESMTFLPDNCMSVSTVEVK